MLLFCVCSGPKVFEMNVNTTPATPFLKPYLKMSVMHLFVPRVVAIILVILGIVLALQRAH